MKARLKLFFTLGWAILIAIGFYMFIPNSNISFAEGEGERLFQANCLGCHSLGGEHKAGPDLMGISEKRDRVWVVKMIQDPQALVDSGDETANQLVKEYGMVMPKINLSPAEVDAIAAYLTSQTASPQVSPSTNVEALTVPKFALYGIIGALILYVMMAVLWRDRLQQVRKNLR